MVVRLLLLVAGGSALAWWGPDEFSATAPTSTASGLSTMLADTALGMGALVAVWAVSAVLVAALRRLPGRLGRMAERVWRWLVPTALRAALLGASGAAVATSSAAAIDAPAATSAHLEVGRPLTSASAAMAVGTTAPTPSPDVSADAPAPGHVVVAGDSLWAIAEQHLGAGATAAQVAAEWPRWFASNRDVVGPDPGLLRVGAVLAAPGAGGAS